MICTGVHLDSTSYDPTGIQNLNHQWIIQLTQLTAKDPGQYLVTPRHQIVEVTVNDDTTSALVRLLNVRQYRLLLFDNTQQEWLNATTAPCIVNPSHYLCIVAGIKAVDIYTIYYIVMFNN